jgi:hypothetical protein
MNPSYNMVTATPTAPIISEERIDAEDQGERTPPQVMPYKTAMSELVRRHMPFQSKDFNDARTIFDLGSWYREK